MGNPLKMKCKVTHISKSGDGVYSIELGPEGRLPRFKPGQFLHLSVDDYDPAGGFWPESRVFSIASRYGSSALRIVYSVKGKYTRLMEERLREGVRGMGQASLRRFYHRRHREGRMRRRTRGGRDGSVALRSLHRRLGSRAADWQDSAFLRGSEGGGICCSGMSSPRKRRMVSSMRECTSKRARSRRSLYPASVADWICGAYFPSAPI